MEARASIGFNHYDYSIVMIMNQDDIQQSVFSALNSWLQYSHDAGIQTLIVNPESSLSALPAFQPDDDYNSFKEIILLILKDSANPDAPLQAICNHGIVGLSIPADKHDYNMFKRSTLIGSEINLMRTHDTISLNIMFADDVQTDSIDWQQSIVG